MKQPKRKNAIKANLQERLGFRWMDLVSIVSAVIATIAAVFSAWITKDQLNVQMEQSRVQEAQLKQQSLQALPKLSISRSVINKFDGTSTLKICTLSAASERLADIFAYWLPEIGRYPRPTTRDHEIKTIRVAVVPDESDRHELALLPSGERCMYIKEPSWIPIARFISANITAPTGFAYWTRSTAILTILLRDDSGAIVPRNYIFTHERSDTAQLLSDEEAYQWRKDYADAVKEGRKLRLTTKQDNADSIASFFN